MTNNNEINDTPVLKQIEFPTGTYLMKEGDMGTDAYYILVGEADVFRVVDGIRVDLRQVAAGNTVGELALISPAPRSASVIAASNVRAILITQKSFDQEVKKFPEWMKQILESFAVYFRQAMDNMNCLYSGDCNFHVLSQIRLLYPVMGKSSYDKRSDTTSLLVDLDELINEIALNLSIPQELIYPVVNRLTDIDILRLLKHGQLMIPNFPLFCMFVDFVAKKNQYRSAIRSDRTPILFANEIETVMSLTDTSKLEINHELEEIIPDSLEALTNCSSWQALSEKLDSVYDSVFHPPG